MNNSILHVGLASFGMSGRIFHAPFIERNPKLNLKLILERTKSNSKKLYPNARIVRVFSEMLHDVEIDLIVINTPSYLHFEMAKQALAAGKHVVLEKPMTATSKEGAMLIKIAKERNLLLAVYHNKRLEGGFKTVKKLLEEGRLGEVTNCHISLHRFKPEIGPKVWKEGNFPGAGLLYDLGSHLLDQCLHLFGWPLKIDADLQIQRKNSQVIDYFSLLIHYKNFDVVLVSDMLTKEKKPSFYITGTKASFLKYGKDPQEERLSEEVIEWENIGADFEENYGLLTLNESGKSEKVKTEQGSYEDFYTNVVDALQLGVPLDITPIQALDVIKVIEWVLETAPVRNTSLDK